MIYVTRRLKRGNCTGRFCKLGRAEAFFPSEAGKLNGLTSTIFLCYEIFLECNLHVVPFLRRRRFSLPLRDVMYPLMNPL